MALNQERFLQNLRSSTIYTTKQDAKGVFATLSGELAKRADSDGLIALSRYKVGGSGDTKTIIGVYSKTADVQEGFFTLYDPDVNYEGISKLETDLANEIAHRKAVDGINGDVYVKHTDNKHLSGATSLDSADLKLAAAIEALATQTQDDNAKSTQYVNSVKLSKGKLTVSRVDLIKSGDEALTVTEGGQIASNLSINKLSSDEIEALQDSANIKEAYKLVGNGTNQLGETIKIYKDSSLKSVTLGHADAKIDTNTGEFTTGGTETANDALLFVYHKENGKYELVEIDVEAFLKEAEFKNGLMVQGGEVSVKLGGEETRKNFLDFEGEVEGEKSLAVRGMDTDKTVTTESIPVAGGPLAELVSKAGIKEITKGDNLQDILMALLCKELLPTAPKRNKASIKSAHGKPTATLDSDGKTVEAGTQVTFSKVTVAEPTVTTTAQTYSGFEYGYATSLNGEITTGNPASVSVVDPKIAEKSYTLTVTGKVSYTATGDAAAINGNASNSAYTITVADGPNEVTASITGSKSTGSIPDSSKYYAASNLSKTYETKPENIKDGDATVASAATYTVTADTSANSASFKVTGDRYGFYQVYAGTPGFDVSSENVRALSEKSFSKFTKITGATGNQQIVVAFPAEWGEIKSVTNDNSLNAPVTDTYVKQSDCMVEGANGYTAVNYHVYLYQSKTVLGDISHTIKIG